MKLMAWLRTFLLAAWVSAMANVPGAAAESMLEATTDDGRRVILHPDGRWELGPPGVAKAPASDQAATPKAGPHAPTGTASTAARPDDRYCQGGLFGVGRRICPGDPDYNRGSLNPKLR
jgi:hypothetical protein